MNNEFKKLELEAKLILESMKAKIDKLNKIIGGGII